MTDSPRKTPKKPPVTPEPKRGSEDGPLDAGRPTLPARDSLKQLTRHILSVAGFEPKEVEYLFTMGLNSPLRFVQSYRSNQLRLYEDSENFPKGSTECLVTLAAFLHKYRQSHSDFNHLKTEFTQEAFELFCLSDYVSETSS